MHHLLRLNRRLRLYRGRRSGLHHRLLNGRLWLNGSLRHRLLRLLHHWLRHRMLLHHRLHAHGGLLDHASLHAGCGQIGLQEVLATGIAASAHDQEGHSGCKDEHTKARANDEAGVGGLPVAGPVAIIVATGIVVAVTVAIAVPVAVAVAVISVAADVLAAVSSRRVLRAAADDRAVVRSLGRAVKGGGLATNTTEAECAMPPSRLTTFSCTV